MVTNVANILEKLKKISGAIAAFRASNPATVRSLTFIAAIGLCIAIYTAIDPFDALNRRESKLLGLADARATSILEAQLRSRDEAIARSDKRIHEQQRVIDNLLEGNALLQEALVEAKARDRKHEGDIARLKQARDRKAEQIDGMDLRELSDELENLGY